VGKIWQVKAGGKQEQHSLEQVKSLLLRQRGIAGSEKDFFEISYEKLINDPYLMADMELAVDRIYQAIDKEQQILVYGDYDVDGISSTAIMVSALRDLGAKVVPFIPHRVDNGYGLDENVLRETVDQFDLIITVDCGISNLVEVEWLNKRGRDVIVTDHHSLPSVLPPALAVIHPAHPKGSYPFKQLSGAAVSWKLATALLHDKRSGAGSEDSGRSYLDLCCLGTVADMMPLVGENRAIVWHGLRALAKTTRVGLRGLVEVTTSRSGIVDAESVAYRMGPLLNAAGRMDHAQPALDLMLATNESEAANKLELLKQLNNERRRVGQKVQSEAEGVGPSESQSLIFVANSEWPVGVLGLVAGRLSEKFGLPAVVLGGRGSNMVGSMRGPEGTNVLKLLEQASRSMIKFGGHKRAAGFSLRESDIDEFRDQLESAAQEVVRSKESGMKSADIVIDEELVGWDLSEVVEDMAPFGQGNERPKFVWRNVYVGDRRAVGKRGEHAKLAIRINDDLVGGIGFGLSEKMDEDGVPSKGMVDILGALEINEYNGKRSLQIRLEDVACAGDVEIVESSQGLDKSKIQSSNVKSNLKS